MTIKIYKIYYKVYKLINKTKLYKTEQNKKVNFLYLINEIIKKACQKI